MSLPPPLDRFPKPPVIIGGCGRSGTTLLLSMLSAHPNILALPRETEALCPGAYGREVDLDAPFRLEAIAAELDGRDIPPHGRWCEKTPKNILFLGRILDFFGPGLKFINIVRDGRDVVLSLHPTRRRERPWVSPERWVRDVQAGRPFDHHPQVRLVKYEDLVGDYPAAMAGICQFLGEEFHPNLLDWHAHATVRQHVAWAGEVERLHARSVDRWRENLDHPHVQTLLSDPAALDLLAHYGYLNE